MAELAPTYSSADQHTTEEGHREPRQRPPRQRRPPARAGAPRPVPRLHVRRPRPPLPHRSRCGSTPHARCPGGRRRRHRRAAHRHQHRPPAPAAPRRGDRPRQPPEPGAQRLGCSSPPAPSSRSRCRASSRDAGATPATPPALPTSHRRASGPPRSPRSKTASTPVPTGATPTRGRCGTRSPPTRSSTGWRHPRLPWRTCTPPVRMTSVASPPAPGRSTGNGV